MEGASVPEVPERPLYPDQEKRLKAIEARYRRTKDHNEKRHALELRALIDDGAEVKAVARYLGVSRQTVYAWLRRA